MSLLSRRRMRARLLLAAGGAALVGGVVVVPSGSAAAAGTCAPPSTPMTFSPPKYVDTTRAGGEPMVQTHPSGRLLYSAHAGTTHFFAPEGADPNTIAFADNYTGQTYVWYSDDHGATWKFVPRTPPSDTNGAPMSGFSDPDFAIDTAGDVFFSEINLANVATYASTDRGATYALKNIGGQVLTDRQWSEADTKDVYYFVGNASMGGTFPSSPLGANGHVLYKTKDGGTTFTGPIPDSGGLG